MTEYFKKQRICKVCGKTFREKDNICLFKCGTHFGHFTNNEWTCCQKKSKIVQGCLKHDHYDSKTLLETYPTLTIDKNGENQELQIILLNSIRQIYRNSEFIKKSEQKFICNRKTF